jgi:hypothetical protein
MYLLFVFYVSKDGYMVGRNMQEVIVNTKLISIHLRTFVDTIVLSDE